MSEPATAISEAYVLQRIQHLECELNMLLDQIVFEPHLEDAALEVLRARLLLLQVLHNHGRHALRRTTTQAMEIYS